MFPPAPTFYNEPRLFILVVKTSKPTATRGLLRVLNREVHLADWM